MSIMLCQGPAEPWVPNMGIGAVGTRIWVLQGSTWVQWVERQGFCGRDKWNRHKIDTSECRVRQGWWRSRLGVMSWQGCSLDMSLVINPQGQNKKAKVLSMSYEE